MASAAGFPEEKQEADLPPSVPVLVHPARTSTTSMATAGSDAKMAHPPESGVKPTNPPPSVHVLAHPSSGKDTAATGYISALVIAPIGPPTSEDEGGPPCV